MSDVIHKLIQLVWGNKYLVNFTTSSAKLFRLKRTILPSINITVTNLMKSETFLLYFL